MNLVRSNVCRAAGRLAAVGAVLALAGCASAGLNLPAPGSVNADKFLFDRGSAAITGKHWLEAREYFQRLVEGYPQSPYRPDAKLGIGDAYLGENTVEGKILAANEYREFLAYFPTNPKADYAQLQIAVCHFRQMLSPDRDQTETQETIKALQAFLDAYPNSPLKPQAETLYREARDRLDDHMYGVGFFYFRFKIYPGAIGRFQEVLKQDPQYTRRDAVYYYLGEALVATGRSKEAAPYFSRLIEEFKASEYLDKAKLALAAIK